MNGIKKIKEGISQALIWYTQDFAKGIRIAIGFLFTIGTAGLLAVAVTGTFNTFTSGGVMKAADINANFASLKAAIEGIPTQKSLRLIYENDITSATTSVNIPGLDGDSDLTYEIVTRFVSGIAQGGGYSYNIRINGDSSSSYFERQIYIDNGSSPTKTVGSSTYTTLCGSTMTVAVGDVCFGRATLFAKSGYVRTLIGKGTHHSSSTNWFNHDYSSIYTITGTNVTSLTILSPTANAIGAGSRIEVWARR